MKAAITPSYGPATILETVDVPMPLVDENDVLVEVYATDVTAGDRRLRSADFPGVSVVPGRLMMGVRRPRNRVQGTMFAGRVVAIGHAVTKFAVGDDVFGSADHGAYAEYIAVAQDSTITTMPEGLSYADAAAVPYGAVTALYFLRELGDVMPRDRVLIVGASGGVGRYAVQVAKYLGAEVTGVCSPRNAELVRELGADHIIDYTTEDFASNGQRYDVIFDIADATSFRRCRKSLTDTGRYLTLFISLRVIFEMAITAFRDGQKAKFGIAMGDHDAIEELSGLLAAGVIRPVIASEFPLERIADAHAEADTGRPQGSVIVTIEPRRPFPSFARVANI